MHSWPCSWVVVSMATALVAVGDQGCAADPESWPLDAQFRTVAEQSNYRATASSAFVVDFVRGVSAQAAHLTDFQFGATTQGRPLIACSVARPDWPTTRAAAGQDDRLLVLINANIHSGECCGKEAMLRMLRELAANPNHPWLSNLVLIVVPNYNADGNDQVAQGNRPGQVGPSEGMGKRANAQGFDLNREYIKLESSEARALVGLMNRYDPHCFIDLHTTNGSWHRYQLTYDVVHNPAAHPRLGELMRGKMMPAVKSNLQDRGIDTFYYGNFNEDHSRWVTTDHRPRFGLDYVSLRGRISILSEAYAYITFQDRITATHALVTECLNYLSLQKELVKRTLATVRHDTITQGAQRRANNMVSIRANIVRFPAKAVVKGFDPPRRPKVRSAGIVTDVAPNPPGVPKDYEVDFFGRFQPALKVSRPYAYLIPAEMRSVTERLKLHGVKLTQLATATKVEVEVYHCQRVERADRPFQQHRLVTVDASKRTERREVPKGTVVALTAQPLGTLLVYLLELESDDGLVTWNFCDAYVREGADFPILRVLQPTLPLGGLGGLPPGGLGGVTQWTPGGWSTLF